MHHFSIFYITQTNNNTIPPNIDHGDGIYEIDG